MMTGANSMADANVFVTLVVALERAVAVGVGNAPLT
tara:strand:+ start:357 stop:464 length:108 start_codon:yes stop_codon:yes gene_type:complete